MNLIPDELREIKRLSAGFETGSLPSWLTTDGTGIVTAYDASNNGGYAELSTSSSSGINLFTSHTYQPNAYDVIEHQTIFTASSGDLSVSKVWPTFLVDTAAGYDMKYELNNEILITHHSGGETQQTIDDRNPTNRHTATLRWYVGRDEIRLFVDGALVGKITGGSNMPDATGTYDARCTLISRDGTTQTLNVQWFSVAYYRDMKVR